MIDLQCMNVSLSFIFRKKLSKGLGLKMFITFYIIFYAKLLYQKKDEKYLELIFTIMN